MRNCIFILLFIPVFSFSQIDWKKGWNGNVEWGMYLSGPQWLKHYDFSQGFLGIRISNDSILDGRLSLRIGTLNANFDKFFLLPRQKHDYYRSSTISLHYAPFNNRWVTPVIGLGLGKIKWESDWESSYRYYDFKGVELNFELWFFPKSRLSFGGEFSLNYGSLSYYSRSGGTISPYLIFYQRAVWESTKPPVIASIRYKLFQKEKVFGKNK